MVFFYSILLTVIAILMDGGLLFTLFGKVLKPARTPELPEIFIQVAIAQGLGWVAMMIPVLNMIPFLGLIVATGWLFFALVKQWELEPRDAGIAIVILTVANYLVLGILAQWMAQMQMAAVGL